MARKPTKAMKRTGEIEINFPWYIWAIGILVIIGIVFWLIVSSTGAFVYREMAFTKESYGNGIIIYHYSYFCRGDGVSRCNVFFHVDPRTNNVSYEGDNIEFEGKQVKLSIDASGLSNCSDSRAGVGALSQWIGINGFNITVGTPDLEQARRYNASVINCDTHPQDLIIMLQASSERSRIYQKGRCHVVEIANCQVFDGVEKFMLETMAQARARSI